MAPEPVLPGSLPGLSLSLLFDLLVYPFPPMYIGFWNSDFWDLNPVVLIYVARPVASLGFCQEPCTH